MNAWRLAPLLFLVGCESPSGRGYAPPDADEDVGVLFPDLSDGEPETVEDTAPDTTPDTAVPPDTTPDTTPPDTSGCAEGASCDDQDPCTVNDRCQAGLCRGDALACDDQLPCTADLCVGGVCQHPVTTGCLVSGVCYSAGQPRPDNACQTCQPTRDPNAWSPQDGASCSDQNPCTTGDTCQGGACVGGPPPAEICGNGLDDNCDGLTDAADLACGGVTPCTYHNDCYPERVCATWATTGQRVCSDPCAGDADCGAGRICSKVPGSAQVGFCQDAPLGLMTNGAACSLDSQCRSGLCTGGMCTPTCLDEASCPLPNATCNPVGDLAAGLLQTTCSPDPRGALPLGQVCAANGGYDGGLCGSGHCDLLALGQPTCSAVCRSESDCAPAMECNLVLAAHSERIDAIPYHPAFTARTTDALTACFTPQVPGGTLADGTPCSSNEQCRSNKCFELDPASPQKWCTTFCTSDAQCPSAMACKLEALNLVSDWLVAAGSARPGARTLVRICKWR